MVRLPPRSTRTDTRFSYTTLVRPLVGRRDAGKLADLAGAGALGQPLGVTLLACLHVGLDVNLVEAPRRRGARAVAVDAVGRDEGGDADDAGVGEELGRVADAPDVLGAIFRRKAEVGVEAAADVVAIQHVDLVALGEELLLDLHGQGRLDRKSTR